MFSVLERTVTFGNEHVNVSSRLEEKGRGEKNYFAAQIVYPILYMVGRDS